MIDSNGNLYITQNSVFDITFYIIVTSSYSTISVNSVQSNYFTIVQSINCPKSSISFYPP